MKWIKKSTAIFMSTCLMVNLIPKDMDAKEQEVNEYYYNDTDDGTVETLKQENEEESEPIKEAETKEPKEEENVSIEDKEETEILTVEESIVTEGEGISHIGDTFADAFIDVLNSKNINAKISLKEGVVNLVIEEGQNQVLELLSQQKQTVDSNYQNWVINFNLSGTLTLGSDFKGLGDSDFPFKGQFTNQSIILKTSNTIFKALSVETNLNNVRIEWTGSPDTPILTKKLVADNDAHTLEMPLVKSTYFSPYIETLEGGSGIITLPSLDYSFAKDSPKQETNSNDYGLLCGEMKENTQLRISSIILPSGVIDLRGSKSVGSLVGSMRSNTNLIIQNDISLNTKIKGKTVGGLVGSIDHGSITISEGKKVSITTEMEGSDIAGGIVGQVFVEDTLFSNTPNIELKSVKVNGTNNAGIYYGTYEATKEFSPLSGITTGSTKELIGQANCGGIFGSLTLKQDGKCIIEGKKESELEVNSTLTLAGNNTIYAGIAGTLIGEQRKNALVLKYAKVHSTIQLSKVGDAYYPKYNGGMIGIQKVGTLDVTNCSTEFTNSTLYAEANIGYGGLVSLLDQNALLLADTITIKKENSTTGKGGGGVVGSSKEGSIVYLKNSLDISACTWTSLSSNYGQIVGKQDCSFIYGDNLSIKRPNLELDDIGNYGEIYRISNFVQIGKDYEVTFLHTLGKTNEEYIFSSALDYASYALAWQSKGNFPTVEGITTSNYTTLFSSTIKLGNDIDLTGCGIGSLSRDDRSEMFKGTLNGNNKSIILDIGNKNSSNEVTNGDGRIYRHVSLGVFGKLSHTAKVYDLTISGSIRAKNEVNSVGSVSVGALCGEYNLGGSSSSNPIKKVDSNVEMDLILKDNKAFIGGLFGLINGGGNSTLNLECELDVNMKISGDDSMNGNTNHIGLFAGIVYSNVKNLTINCDNITISGSIVDNRKNTKNLYCGGFIGSILPYTGSNRVINIENLNFSNVTLESSASERNGGMLGGIWADTNVNFNHLKIENCSINQKEGNAQLGGLVYRASGKWSVNKIDMKSLSISVPSSNGLGLLVCQGGPYKETINGTEYTNLGALYLEMNSYWETGYIVPNDRNINFDGSVFDEFVAYSAHADSQDATPNYQITRNRAGIISLKTNNDTVNMSTGERNTYLNRTDVGKTKQTNIYSRYYYNIPTVLNSCDGNEVDTAKELLIWTLYRYATTNIRDYFKGNVNVETNVLGGSSATSHASFDLKGYSYYPINITNSDIKVQYCDIKFYNKEIEEKETSNKTTRGDNKNHSQHYMMHAGLFHNYNMDLTNSDNYETRSMTLNGVTFSGSISKINGGSGALICGSTYGDNKDGNSKICQIILASEDSSNRAILLDGIVVDSDEIYKPVLINTIGAYSNLNSKYIASGNNQTSIAGSSLIGNVGSQTAQTISLSFEGTLKIEEKGVFSEAILLNSLRYEKGSATYNFFKEKDWEENKYVHNVTYGKEISSTVEYEGKQGCYYDGYGEGNYISSNSKFNEQNDFSTYLPYVAYSPASKDSEHTLENKWHEIAVNVLLSDLVEGCGTYGHPYEIDDAEKMNAVANCINNGTITNGWKLRIKNNENYHNDEGDNDYVIQYEEGSWKKEDGSTLTFSEKKYIQKYLANAYYKITGDIELKNFQGLGTSEEDKKGERFSGVIIGENKTTITLSGTSTSLIKYSYGSVVKDLKIILDEQVSIVRGDWSREYAYKNPSSFFGGVIGCVLGGDNIIDDVSLKTSDNFTISTSGNNDYLIPIGGYVGVICGGGIIFRNSISSNTGINGKDSQIYKNPIIGRVLDGFAFYEGDQEAPDNTNKNYKINKIEGSDSFTWDGNNVVINNEQGLLLFSAVTNSGAGSGTSAAYVYGKARNAKYDHIGQATESDDYIVAKNDAGTSWTNGNTPYLLKQYAGYSGTISICGHTGITLSLVENTTYDMSEYKNGYRGISARYVSNAAFKDTKVDPTCVVLRMKNFDGKNATITGIDMEVEEYDNDDFHMASMGGVFNICWTKNESGGSKATTSFVKNLTLSDLNVVLQYIKQDGSKTHQADRSLLTGIDGCSCVTVGGLFGSVSDISKTSTTNSNYLFENLKLTANKGQTHIYGPNSAGGFIGASAMSSNQIVGYPGKLLTNSSTARFGPNFLNCSYNNVDISAELSAGGFVGQAYLSNESTVPTQKSFTNFIELGLAYNSGNSHNCVASVTITKENFVVGSNSTITGNAKRSVVGGMFGGAGMLVAVNYSSINTISGLAVITSASDIKVLNLKDVSVTSAKNDYRIIGGGFVVEWDGPKNGDKETDDSTSNASIVGRIGGSNPSWFYKINVENCTITTGLTGGATYVGGIVGYGYTNNKMTIELCNINNSELSGTKWTGGFLGYGNNNSSFKLYLSNCKIEDSIIKSFYTSRDTYAGGVVGRAYGKYYFYNVLIKNTSILSVQKNGNKETMVARNGRLFGFVSKDEYLEVIANGLSYYVDADKKDIVITNKLGCINGNDDPLIEKTFKGYISYADYAGTENAVSGYNSPYVVANPSVALNSAKTITGDATGTISGETLYGSVAAKLWADCKPNATNKTNLVTYSNSSSIVKNSSSDPVISTFNSVNELSGDTAFENDFPVLVIDGSDASIIEDYIDVITNGGYRQSGIKLTNTVYYYDKSSKQFNVATSQQLQSEPASIYLYDGKTPKVTTNAFDNTRNRINVIEATFTIAAMDGNPARTYTVSVPVVVQRELEYNFMATFSYGTEFNSEVFKNIKTHILEGTGNAITAYLTYQYNRKEEETVEYDWQSFMDNGGDLIHVNKVLNFSSGLPAGTQMILVDTQKNDKAFSYTTTTSEKDIQLSKFVSIDDNKDLFVPSMDDVLDIQVTSSSNGKYIIDKTNPTVIVDGISYRPIQEKEVIDSTVQRYSLTVSNSNLEENYYLVITVPNQSDENFYLNGLLTSSLDWQMPSKGSMVHRYNGSSSPTIGNNDETTYQISAGYQQTLKSNTKSIGMDLAVADNHLAVNAEDTIRFSNKQIYNDSDNLYYGMIVSLSQKQQGTEDSSNIVLPAGTKGTVYFYAQDEQGYYYDINGNKLTEKTKITSYEWISSGKEMELTLSNDGQTPLSLSKVRNAIKGNSNSEYSQLNISTEMEIDFVSEDVMKEYIPASQSNGTDQWVQMHFVSNISTQASSLFYSPLRTSVDDSVKYYRSVTYQAILSMDANSINQLGINPLELVPEYETKKNGRKASKIGIVSSLNLSNLSDIETILETTSEIQFTLSLKRGGQSNYENAVEKIQDYVDFDLSQYNHNEYTWSIPQSEYYDTESHIIKKSAIFDGKQFVMPFDVYVYVDQTEFANYKIELKVKLIGSKVQITDADAYIIYTYACIKPEYYDPNKNS